MLVNFDETSVKLVPDEKPGFFSRAAHHQSATGKAVGKRIGRSATRACVTHLAAICTCPHIQKELPQVILVGEKQMSSERFARVQEEKPNCVHIWREPRAWVTTAVMKRYVRLLGRCLLPQDTPFYLLLRRVRCTRHLIGAPKLRPARLLGVPHPCQNDLGAPAR